MNFFLFSSFGFQISSLFSLAQLADAYDAFVFHARTSTNCRIFERGLDYVTSSNLI